MALTRKKDPAFVIGYMKPKGGKTTDLLYFNPNGDFLAQLGSLKPCHEVCGFELRKEQVHNISTLNQATAEMTSMAKARGSAGLILGVDDLTHLVNHEVMGMEDGEQLEGFTLWRQVRNRMLRFRKKARELGVHVYMNCHEKGPTVDQQTKEPLRGGPALPGKMVEDLPSMCDAVFRGTVESDMSDKILPGYWPAVFRNDPTSDYIMGGREGVVLDPMPLNMAEYLRFTGHDIPRYKEIAGWQETAVEKLSIIFLSKAPVAGETLKLIEQAESYVRKNCTKIEAFVRWTVRDALARAQLRRALIAYNARPPLYGIAAE